MAQGGKQIELAGRILDWLRKERLPAGARLAEARLADVLGVSRSPVRAALATLAEAGVVAYQPKRGYELCDASLETALPVTDDERIYRTMASEHFAKLIGEQISVSGLVRRYGVGRAVINRVLARMSEEGLIERAPGRGWVFRPALIDEDAYDESYRFRELVEPAAILEPGFRIDRGRFAELRRAHAAILDEGVDSLPMGRLFEADAQFHEAIAACCANRFLAQTIRQQTRLRRLSEYENYSERARLAESLGEHLEILDAIEAGEMLRAAELMRRHVAVSQAVKPDFNKVRFLAHRRLTRR
ncbi:GntR family transcriptional regulator [Pelagibius litoralis]|uniref:GntR family transcriptional regulator n=1 Tax=Pelagibius litoralis TaxID=374515 RepID=A0A967CB19_9PROT|nr:GntR family transcriptional regulator [Pelagibius litoralis]NIA68053.1 GntR family transcriptional regulator [Pelagibius litoralis]